MELKCKYKIGDVIEVIFPGQHYPTHERLFKLLEFKNTKSNSYFDDKIMSTQWKIFQTHSDEYDHYVALRNKNNEELLMSADGVKLIKRNIKNYSLWN